MTTEPKIEILWGVKAISRAIGKPPRGVYHLLENGRIPAKKIGRQWTSTREALDKFFADQLGG
jgi:hypothetical protein